MGSLALGYLRAAPPGRRTGKPDFSCFARPWTVDCGLWTVGSRLKTQDSRLLAVAAADCGQWTVDCGLACACPRPARKPLTLATVMFSISPLDRAKMNHPLARRVVLLLIAAALPAMAATDALQRIQSRAS